MTADRDEYVLGGEPIHEWFELTYSAYLVLPRSVLQSMPAQWQTRFVELLMQLDAAADGLEGMPASYRVTPLGEAGRRVDDPYRDYERGRRRIALKPVAPKPSAR